ncbi:site-specific integrase [Aquimarina sp. ERC-38]|uniref:tyrosine-type recombinase/integrase n=1 Tax=Aquimarina sp. ERC-38 TaxID=2949996 RepID=UPI002245D0C5|nr:site-specific integrase [Aquimarina sp. ERC-38]UZO79730.1 site-specific integrase [Aquimarina sp. ERC-38]
MNNKKLKVAVEVAVSQFAAKFRLVNKDQFQDMPLFKKARFVHSEGTTKGSYILFYVWDVQKGDLTRKRLAIPQQYKTLEQQKAFAKVRCKQIDRLLKEGYHIDRNKQKLQQQDSADNSSNQTIKEPVKLKERVTIDKAITSLVAIRIAKKYSENGINTYRKELKAFLKWGQVKKKPLKFIDDITFSIIQDYQLYILTELKNESKTHNNKIGVISAFYSDCIKQEWIDKENNPFEKVDELPTNYGTKNKPYTNDQIKEIKEYVLQTNPYLWNFIAFIYYSFLRPNELKALKVSDIDLKNNIIKVWVEGTKGKRCDVLPIAPALREVILKMNIDQYPGNYFLFGSKKEPSFEKLGKNYITKNYLRVKKHFGIDENKDYTIYGFKHTACVNWYKAEKDIVKIQKMCRHKSVTMTERYLKSLGLLEEENAVALLPEI